MNLHSHIFYLKDTRRVQLFADAIRQLVKPGDVVIDLGAGTGILGMIALKAGAKKVISIDKGPILNVAKLIATENNLFDQIDFRQQKSNDVTLRKRADVIVSETIGYFGIDERILHSVSDANTRLLKKGGVVIPSDVSVRVCPVSVPSVYREKNNWNTSIQGISFKSLHSITTHHEHVLKHWPQTRLAAHADIFTFTLRGLYANPLPAEGQSIFRINRPGTMHGMMGWFHSNLTNKISIESGPNIHWQPIFLSLDRPLRVQQNDRVIFTLRVDPDISYTWTYRIMRKKKTIYTSRHSTLLYHDAHWFST